MLGEMLADLGCVNIADSETSLLEELSMEAILAADPDRIFIVMQGSDAEKVQKTLDELVLSNPAWQQLTAVQEGRVHYMDPVSYTHLDVYKRQLEACRPQYPELPRADRENLAACRASLEAEGGEGAKKEE